LKKELEKGQTQSITETELALLGLTPYEGQVRARSTQKVKASAGRHADNSPTNPAPGT